MTYRHFQNSFAGGELSPELYSRTDTARYSIGLKTAKNVIIQKFGGIVNRSGLEFICEARDGSNPVRLIPFSFNTEQTYILEIGNGYMRPITQGSQILTDTDFPIENITASNPAVITITGHTFENGIEIYIYDIAGMDDLNQGNFIVSDATTNTFALKYKNGNYVDSTVFDAYVSGGIVRKVYSIGTPYLGDDVTYLNYVQQADTIYICHVDYPIHKFGRYATNNWTITQPTFTSGMASPPSCTADAAIVATNSTSATFGEPSSTTINYDYFPVARTYKVSAISADTGEESLPSPESGTAVNDLTKQGNYNRISWPAVPGASHYLIYCSISGGPHGFMGRSTTTSFTDNNITPDYSDGPQGQRVPFTGEGNYPRCATFYEQRLIFASTRNQPQAIWMSQSASPENFNVSSPTKDNDAITLRLTAEQVNEIRAVFPTRTGLMLLTSGGEWIVTPSGDEGYLTPANPHVQLQSRWTSGYAAPVLAGNIVLFAQNHGGTVRDFNYDIAQDGYASTDLTIFSKHLFEGVEIRRMAYSQTPMNVIWVILTDGRLCSLTYLKEQEVWAWAQHDTDGYFEDVVVISEDGEDVPYFVVLREIEGIKRRYIERMRSRIFKNIESCFFVDSGLTYAGSPVNEIKGLHHLEGKTLIGLADGNVVKNIIVKNGKTTLPNKMKASKISVGLSFWSEIVTLRFDGGNVQGLGSIQARAKQISKIIIRVINTRGFWGGMLREDDSKAEMIEHKSRSSENYGEPTKTKMGDFDLGIVSDWNSRGSVVIEQRDPLPLSITGIMYDILLGK